MKIFCDNTGAIALAKESRFHETTKHIKRCFNSIRDQIKEGDIEICKIHTDLNVADPLTKPRSGAKHDQHQDSMGVRIITMQSRLLTLVQVGDLKKYALEAIIKFLFIFPYIMINVYYSC